MQSLLAIADPTRRRIVELLAQGDRTSGELVDEFDLSAPAIRVEGQRRIQTLNPAGFDELEAWLERTRSFWSQRLDALERELKADEERNDRARKKKP